MAYVVVDTCTKDNLCVDACPVDCIHPKQDEPDFEAAAQVFIDPEACRLSRSEGDRGSRREIEARRSPREDRRARGRPRIR